MIKRKCVECSSEEYTEKFGGGSAHCSVYAVKRTKKVKNKEKEFQKTLQIEIKDK